MTCPETGCGRLPPKITPPAFASASEGVARLGDVDFWWPHLAEILKRHDLFDGAHEPVPGHNPTYPTFLHGDTVVKLFGNSRAWRASHAAERAALRLVASDPRIVAPRLLAAGTLFPEADALWPYLVMTRVTGVASWRVEMAGERRLSLAAELGRQVRLVHALRPSIDLPRTAAPAVNAAAAAAHSSLPPHLIAQVDGYLAKLGTFGCIFVHGDLVATHAFVDNDRLSGIIDWGDAMVTDPHYELIQLYRDMFGCDKALFSAFLAASDWPVGKDFPHRTLGLALHRQAVGLAQHHTMDVFEPIAALLPLEDIGTLDELATELFAV